ncbi:winged helix DNA-binding domain-containing protein [Hamadaea tsunoensis]|uniref:winged helix DNA-binding domain-containing protein n=1 Tax=Hamadaea tsunoensis TaxID=53368 RepID=UPI0004135AF4|nr:winged helix DNA-binding domain-containing protein [Hamadaea tsunoensis]
MGEKLSLRELNRATLARQMLLDRVAMAPDRLIDHLVGLQAQTTTTWYAGLWARITDFDPQTVVSMMRDRRLVRVSLMRSTIHLVSDRDCLELRPLLNVVGERSFATNWGKNLRGADLAAIVAAGRELLDEQPATFSVLGGRLQERFPGLDGASMAQAVRTYACLVQIPPRGLWGHSGLAVHETAEHYLGRPLAANPSVDDLLLRYLGAFGPASVNDARTWSGLTGLGEVFERLRPKLRVFVGEDGRELFDLPEAPRPGGDVPAPVRLLYDFDNIQLSHADRTRVIDGEHRRLLWPLSNTALGSVLVDGFTAGSWKHIREKKTARLVVTSFKPFPRAVAAEIEAEGLRLLAFQQPAATDQVVEFATAD